MKDLATMEYSPRKNSFDIISLLGAGNEETTGEPPSLTDEDMLKDERVKQLQQRQPRDSSELPSFWHLVQPESSSYAQKSNEIFHHRLHNAYHQNHHSSGGKKEGTPTHHNLKHKNIRRNASTTGAAHQRSKLCDNVPPVKSVPRRRKVKKSQNEKVADFKSLERSPERLQREGVEWLRVLTPPGTDTFSTCDADDDDDGDEDQEDTDDQEDDEDDDQKEDELIKRYFSGLSSAGSSISWAEDAMESEFTSQLLKLWDDIESVCAGGYRPEKMSDAVFDECLQWRRAFPNPDLHRFSKNRSDISPIESPSLVEDVSLISRGENGDGDAAFSSLFHAPLYYKNIGDNNTRRGYDDSMNLLQSNFRTLNCATPRPNIEKSTKYVSAWLTECQNTYVPATSGESSQHDRPSSIISSNGFNGFSSPQSIRNSSSHTPSSSRQANIRNVSEVARSSYAHYSRGHAKFIAEPDPDNFFTSLAIKTNNETYTGSNYHHPSKVETFREGKLPAAKNGSNGMGAYGLGNEYQNRDDVSDEEYEDEDAHVNLRNPSELMSFRSSVRVQRPISSRVRDHTMTPLATGSYGHRLRQGVFNLNSQVGPTVVNSVPVSRSPTRSATASTTLVDLTRTMRIQSGVVRNNFPHRQQLQFGRMGRHQQQQQAPWSRHSREDLASEENNLSPLFENGTGMSTGFGTGDPKTSVDLF